MNKHNILRKLKSHGVSDDDMITFSLKLKDKSFTTKDCNNILVKLGYEQLFSTTNQKTNVSNRLLEIELINEYLKNKTPSNNKIDIETKVF